MDAYPLVGLGTDVEEAGAREDVANFFSIVDVFFKEGFYLLMMLLLLLLEPEYLCSKHSLLTESTHLVVIIRQFLWMNRDNIRIRISPIITQLG